MFEWANVCAKSFIKIYFNNSMKNNYLNYEARTNIGKIYAYNYGKDVDIRRPRPKRE